MIEAMKAWQDPVIGRAVGLLVPPSEKAIIAAVNETSQLGPEVMATSPTSNHYQLATDVGRIEPSRPTTPFLHPQIDISAKGCHEGEDNRSSSLYARFYFILSIFYFLFFFFLKLELLMDYNMTSPRRSSRCVLCNVLNRPATKNSSAHLSF